MPIVDGCCVGAIVGQQQISTSGKVRLFLQPRAVQKDVVGRRLVDRETETPELTIRQHRFDGNQERYDVAAFAPGERGVLRHYPGLDDAQLDVIAGLDTERMRRRFVHGGFLRTERGYRRRIFSETPKSGVHAKHARLVELVVQRRRSRRKRGYPSQR
ncbi:MAG: hypothetical protein NTU83_09910 [Candidatus Hydrogenedentes bacterium]|nr:hypothetical protein [Candidatus Hydrogenedentota bacterium]